MVFLKKLFFFLVFPVQGFALMYSPLDGTPLDTKEPAGPVQRSSLYIVNAPTKIKKATTNLVLDTPTGAIMVFLEETAPRTVQIITPDRTIPLQLEQPTDIGQEVSLDVLSAGKHHLELTGILNDTVSFIVSQPNSPLILEVQSNPLSARTGDTIEVIATLVDISPPKQALLEAHLLNNGPTKILTAETSTQFKARFIAPAIKKGMGEIGTEVIATGIRYDGTPFRREAMTRFVVTTPVTQIEPNIFVSESGDMELTIAPISTKKSTELRLDVYYAYQGKKIAWAREDFVGGAEPTRVCIERPNIAKAADGALVRLVNMHHFGVEDTRFIRLPRDAQASKQFILPSVKPLALPNCKRRALENN